MANNENLKPPINKRPTDEQREIRIKAGIKSGERRRERKALKEQLLLMLESGEVQSKLCTALIDKALKGDTKAFEIIRDTIGEKPTDKADLNVSREPIRVEIVE